MEFPVRCNSCGNEVWIDLERPIRYTTGIVRAEVYRCTCEAKIIFFISTRSLDDAMEKLRTCDPRKQQFKHLFSKTLKKALGVREKYGKSRSGK